jgi:hypothetical protein
MDTISSGPKSSNRDRKNPTKNTRSPSPTKRLLAPLKRKMHSPTKQPPTKRTFATAEPSTSGSSEEASKGDNSHGSPHNADACPDDNPFVTPTKKPLKQTTKTYSGGSNRSTLVPEVFAPESAAHTKAAPATAPTKPYIPTHAARDFAHLVQPARKLFVTPIKNSKVDRCSIFEPLPPLRPVSTSLDPFCEALTCKLEVLRHQRNCSRKLSPVHPIAGPHSHAIAEFLMTTPEDGSPLRKSTSGTLRDKRASIRFNQHRESLPDSMRKVEALDSAVAIYYRPAKAKRVYIASTP